MALITEFHHKKKLVNIIFQLSDLCGGFTDNWFFLEESAYFVIIGLAFRFLSHSSYLIFHNNSNDS